ncbi:MAG: RluA family pseudouridine synthase [Lachnospirales bacterium]
MKEIIISPTEEQRIDKFLLKYLNKSSKSFIYKMIRKKNIKVNNKKVEVNYILKTNDLLTLYLSDETISKFQEKIIYKKQNPLNIVYEDNNMLILNKPVGLLCHGDKNENDNILINQILYYFQEQKIIFENGFVPGLCNRLDRNTSGLVVCGKTLKSTQELNRKFHDKEIEKYYLTILDGELENKKELLGYHVKDNNKVSIFDIEVENSKKVHSIVTPLKNNSKNTYCEVQLITGKSHQIRVHMQNIGAPIIGDKKYGRESTNKFFSKKYNLDHQLLHCYKIIIDNKEYTCKPNNKFTEIYKKEF